MINDRGEELVLMKDEVVVEGRNRRRKEDMMERGEAMEKEGDV